MYAFLVGSLFPLLTIFLGVKALTPAGIELGGGKKLSRNASTVIGLVVICCSLAAIAVLFAYCVLGIPRL